MAKRAAKGRPTKAPKRSPLYTSRDRELTKREVIRDFGKDADGAYRARRRLDQETQ